MPDFNLVRDPWIPVRWRDGRLTRPLVSLREAFTEGQEIADLSCAPHERVSLIRLLVCVTQAALGAPANSYEWNGWGGNIATAVPDYLEKWKNRFNLFGDGHRFLQVKLEKTQQAPLMDFLEFKLKSNETLFDHYAGSHRCFKASRIALSLLTLQNFFLPGSTGSPKIGGIKGAGVSINYLHAFIVGKNLQQTVILNCLDEETVCSHYPADSGKSMGRPSWEKIETDESIAIQGKELASRYLGRLVPMPCLIWLCDDLLHIYLSQGIEYPEFSDCSVREPSATVLVRTSSDGKKTELVLLKADPGKAIWRDLHSVAYVQRTSGGAQCGPLILQSHLNDHLLESGGVDIWCGELVRAKDSKGIPTAKLECLMEGNFPAPAEMFTVDGQARYEHGIKFAIAKEGRLRYMVKVYQDQLRPKPARPNKDIKKDYPKFPAAQRHFWNALDLQCRKLLDLLPGMLTENDRMGHWPFGTRHDDGSFDPWSEVVYRAVRDAYDHACPRQTPRQLQAYAAGFSVLHNPNFNDKEKAANQPT